MCIICIMVEKQIYGITGVKCENCPDLVDSTFEPNYCVFSDISDISIFSCPRLVNLKLPYRVKRLSCIRCTSLVQIIERGSNLEELILDNCPNLYDLPHPHLMNKLKIIDCPIQKLIWSPYLKELELQNCVKGNTVI